MAKDIDKIEIREPPLQELNKKRSCLLRTCMTGCSCVVVFIVVGIILIWFATTPRVRELKNVPAELIQIVPMYDQDSIDKIRFTKGKDRGRAIERATYIPKIVLSPLLALLERNTTSTMVSGQTFDWLLLQQIIDTPVTDHRDLYQIEWQDLSATPSFVETYYETEFKKKKFNFERGTETDETKQYIFSKNDIQGSLLIETDAESAGTKYTLLTVIVPTEKK